MSKLSRYTQLIFGSTAGTNQMAEFGSFANGTPARYTGSTITPTIIQTLSQYLSGWTSAIVGSNSPCIEDMNALCYLFAYQLAYLFQEGIPEWDSATTYYTGSFVQSAGVIYMSLSDSNVNHATSNATYWLQKGPISTTISSTQSFTVPSGVTSIVVTPTYQVAGLFAPGSSGYTPMARTPGGLVFSWGYNASGQLGTGDVTPRSSPVMVIGGQTFVQVASGNSNGYGLSSSGALYAWGISTGTGIGTQSSPVLITSGPQFIQISAGNLNIYGLAPNGAAYAWGSNTYGQLGNGNVSTQTTPQLVLGGLTFSQIFAGSSSGYGLTAAGAAYAWGNNADGELGIGNVTSKSSPIAVLGGLVFTQLAAGSEVAYGLTAAGAAYAWGYNSNGQLGVGDVTPRSSPVAVLGGLTFTQLVSGANSCYGLTAAGAVYAWGNNANGQLGLGDVTPRSSPVAVLGGLTFIQIAACVDSCYGLTSAGAVYAWGQNTYGQLGVGDVTPRSSPVLVLGPQVFSTFPQGLAPATTPSSTRITVIPGNSYTITLSNATSTFGTTPVAWGPVSSLLLTYVQ